MEIRCYPRLSKEQIERLPKNYVPPLIEGTYLVDDEHPNGIIFIYVGYCDWEGNFDRCLKEFILTVFHETMFYSRIEDHIPQAEKILSEILDERG
ncbi:hypothetical protein CW705_02530 [Candidatus Bathyarchaeota archaeon]|nr:MAG: hypothetical protein CW705_02530 [Candidatus Bathyarchaeota archaeon]